MSKIRERSYLALIMLLLFGIRVWQFDQPIVENYVGRQIPTAMVARNLDRGSGFLHPQLDTGPFPNLFLVEPPIYATTVVALKRLTGLEIGPSGRLLSAIAIVLGSWGLYGLVRRREGTTIALVALAAFGLLPVLIRYGRAVQPDALMLGTQLAGLRCWDHFVHQKKWWSGAAGWILLGTSLALKITSIFILVPLAWGILGWKDKRLLVGMALAILPALCWYGYVATVIDLDSGSRASVDNRRIWIQGFRLETYLNWQTYAPLGRYLGVRLFTPIGLVAGLFGLRWVNGKHLWWTWMIAGLLGLFALAAKWHHEYYWMVLSPPIAVGIASTLDAVAARSRLLGTALGLIAICSSFVIVASTWRTPIEWSTLEEAGAVVRWTLPPDALIVGPEALLYQADRRGCRLEYEPSAAARAAGEWGGRLQLTEGPLALVEFYREQGAAFLVDLPVGTGSDPARSAFRSALRDAYRVVVDRPEILIVRLEARLQGEGNQ